jgi:hypothetical protein
MAVATGHGKRKMTRSIFQPAPRRRRQPDRRPTFVLRGLMHLPASW